MALIKLSTTVNSKSGFGRHSTFDIFRLRRLLNDYKKKGISLDSEDIKFLKNIFSLKNSFSLKLESDQDWTVKCISTNQVEIKVKLQDQSYRLVLEL